MHITCPNPENDRRAMTRPDLACRCSVWRQMNVFSFSFKKPMLKNGAEKALGSAVIKNVGRLYWFEPKIDGDRMTLPCSDTCVVLTNSKSLLIVTVYYFIQLLSINNTPIPFRTRQQLINFNPAKFIKRDANHFRFVPEHKTEKLTDPCEVPFQLPSLLDIHFLAFPLSAIPAFWLSDCLAFQFSGSSAFKFSGCQVWKMSFRDCETRNWIYGNSGT